ncbi:uncharacterized protein CLAFUR5_07489 [Fulvia fulva]|uniref:Transmembrane protein n=1 Tax=Passalora fulva TaxID=5499 RepID=A0A9Q8PAV0_PASFU|nr:uncharacterized protein CLAFUR5_07489 [Fulvia fulva]KAK4623036.1 hypothetical protein CLAFUR0_07364 [Fulvia fulva]UJO19085.1 hypothetical protein CLAFUR5_07489 [Fulvia fulva]WPV31051.1 hypothetical protein CLAFUW7_07361 [Fulvia fulva]
MSAAPDSHLIIRALFGDPERAADQNAVPAADEPLAAQVVSICVSLLTMPVLGACLTRRIERVKKWSRLPVSAWLLLLIYIDSFLFIFVTAVLKDIGLNESPGLCDGAILLCLMCYMSTKILIYTFLVEKAWVVRGCLQRRLESKLYLFNCFGMLLPYGVAVVLNFVWRVSFLDTNGLCHIGMEKRAVMPLIIFEAVVNLYLNILFIIPLRKLYSYRHGNGKMRTLALRTFVGSCATLMSSVVNLTILMTSNGEPGWICLLLCNLDILFCVLVLHWVTTFDSVGSTHGDSTCSCSHASHTTALSQQLPTIQVPEPVMSKRRKMFGIDDDLHGFPDECWKAHPWTFAKSMGSPVCDGHHAKCEGGEVMELGEDAITPVRDGGQVERGVLEVCGSVDLNESQSLRRALQGSKP